MTSDTQALAREARDSDSFILRPGHNCWRVGTAGRAAALVDGAAYFAALTRALRSATKRIFIAGWDIHALAPIVADGHRDDGGNLRSMLLDLAERNENLEVFILLWDFTVLYAPDRLPFPKAMLDWSMPDNVKLRLDAELPVGAAHHQKIVVVDDRVAFAGGIDLTEGRWDTRAHDAHDERRQTARGEPYPPFHDIQLAVDGEAAAALGELCRQRWQSCTDEALGAVESAADPWPEDLDPMWRDVEVGIARTVPARDGVEGVDEVAQAHVDSIETARECIYVENQYLTADCVRDALAAQLARPQGPEVVLVTRAGASNWLERNTMNVRRDGFVARLRKADAYGRLRVFVPQVPGVGIDDYKLHSKLMIVDDRLVRVGSANLNNRSMGLDTECDLLLLCGSAGNRRAAAAFRNGLLAEHLGVTTARVAKEVEAHGSVVGAIETLRGGARTLVELPAHDGDVDENDMLPELADADGPVSAEGIMDRLLLDRGPSAERPIRAIARIALALVVILGLALAWRFTPLKEWVDPTIAAALLSEVPRGATGAAVALAAFVLGSLVVFPVTVLIFAVSVAFGPWLGFVYSALGAYFSAALTFGLGRLLGREPLQQWSPATAARIGRYLARRGAIAIAILRIVPVAPFSVINVLAGASSVGFRDYSLGTVLGMTPGIVVLVAMGGQLGAVLRDPSSGAVLILATLVLLWGAIGFGLLRLVNRLDRRRSADR